MKNTLKLIVSVWSLGLAGYYVGYIFGHPEIDTEHGFLSLAPFLSRPDGHQLFCGFLGAMLGIMIFLYDYSPNK